MSSDEPRRTRFREVLLAEAIAALESEGTPLADAGELAAAHRSSSALDDRIIERAWRLARREGLTADLAALQRRMPWLLLAGTALVAGSAYAILAAVVGEGRSINVVMAFVSLLGLHGAALLLWLLAALRGSRGGGLPQSLLALAARRLSPARRRLLQAAEAVTARSGLAPWAFGFASHAMWLLAFAIVGVGLWVAFAFHAFRLGWETTILGPDAFLGFMRATSWLPEKLGFPTATAAWQSDVSPAERHRLLAWWLIACTVAYGLLPRLLLAPLCALVWRRRARHARLDPSAPWVRRLASRFDRLDASTIVDADPGRVRPAGGSTAAPVPTGPLALVGFELPPEAAWPIEPFAAAAAWTRRLEGREDERQALADSVAAESPGRLLVAVDAGASPDRGTGHLLRSLSPQDRAVALLLLDRPGRRAEARRWRAWLRDEDLAAITLLPDAQAARRWAGLDGTGTGTGTGTGGGGGGGGGGGDGDRDGDRNGNRNGTT
jgi:hypothetical protein